MERYKVEIKQSAVKEIEKLPKIVLKRILKRIDGLSMDPRPANFKKLTGKDLYRVRVGVYRILYQIKDEIITVYVVKVGHRKKRLS